jgi:hypothetical protein
MCLDLKKGTSGLSYLGTEYPIQVGRSNELKNVDNQ